MRDFFFYIHTLGALPGLPRPLCVGLETRNHPGYGQTGASRRGRSHAVFQYTLSGRGLFRDVRGEHAVVPGRGFLCESHDPDIAYAFPKDARDPWRFIFIDMAGRATHAMVHDMVQQFGGVYDLAPDHPVVQRLLAFSVHDAVGCMLSPLESSRLVLDLLHALLEGKIRQREAQPDHRLVRRLHDMIRANIAENPTVGAMAERLGVSREHLTRVVSACTGMGPQRYLQTYKVEQACALLYTQSLSVKEVAVRLGFAADVARFGRVFKRIVLCTPGAFRRSGRHPYGVRRGVSTTA